MMADSDYELYVMDADAARHAADNHLRAQDERCMQCREAYCPAAFGGGWCPLEEEQDYRAEMEQRFAASRGR